MKSISFLLNGVQRNLTVDDTRMLLWVLRDDLGLTGAKVGCVAGSRRPKTGRRGECRRRSGQCRRSGAVSHAHHLFVGRPQRQRRVRGSLCQVRACGHDLGRKPVRTSFNWMRRGTDHACGEAIPREVIARDGR
jgi:hypothetical protein